MPARSKNHELKSQAERYGFNSLQSFRQALDRNQIPGALKNSNGTWSFPNEDEIDYDIFDDNIKYPDIEESKKKAEYYKAIECKAKAEQAYRSSQREKGRLVDKKKLEDKYASELSSLRDKLLEIPITLKMRLGEDFDETIVKDLIVQSLKDFVNEQLS